MAIISINYNDGNRKKLGYNSISLSLMSQTNEIIFNTGNFIKDWYDCIKHIIINQIDEPVCHSSSVDHFIMDGAPYDSAYLKTDSVPSLSYEPMSNGLEFFVEKDTKPTWEELKNLCGDKKK